MQSLANELYETIKSCRITNVKDCLEDIVSVLQEDKALQTTLESKLSKDDILWFNKNNESIFFAIPEESYYSSNKKLDLGEEVKWFIKEINSDDKINWDNLKYRYKQALKLLGSKDVIYYNNIREVIAFKYQDQWRYLNE